MEHTCTKIPFDLDSNSDYCDGYIMFENRILFVYENGAETQYSADEMAELIIRSDVGCGSLEIRPKNSECSENNIPVCRFTMTCIDSLGELCKSVNHFIDTGEETEVSLEQTRICPKCGRHYMGGMNKCIFCTKKTGLYKRIFKLAVPYTKYLVLSGIMVLLANAASALNPVLNAKILDDFLYAPNLEMSTAIKGILSIAAIMITASLTGQIFTVIGRRSASIVSAGISHSLRTMVYEKLQKISLKKLQNRTGGDLMGRVTDDTEEVKDFISEDAMRALYQGLLFLVIVVILCTISPMLTILVLLPVPIGLYIFYMFRVTVHIRYMKQWRCERQGKSVLRDIVEGIRVVKLFGAEQREISKYDKISLRLAKIGISNERLWALTFPYVTFFIGIGEFLVIFFGGKMAINGDITAGQLLQFTLYLAYLYGPIDWFSRLPQKLGRVNTSIIKIFEILDETEEAELVPATLTNATFNDKIEFKNVRFGYTAYEPVLKDINLTVNKGEMIGLVGHSGAGKSTMINLIMRLYDVDAGQITIDGDDIRAFEPEEYRSKVAVVFQQTFLFAGSIYDNIAYAKPNAEADEIIRAAKIANAHDFIMKLPDGYNTQVGENAHTLSGGEKQRIAIARAVLRDPEILILDEATSALDTQTESLIQEAMSRLVKGRTTFAIAHRLSTLKDADRLVVIEKGRIAEVGSHSELVKRGGIYASLVAAQKQTAKLRKTEN